MEKDFNKYQEVVQTYPEPPPPSEEFKVLCGISSQMTPVRLFLTLTLKVHIEWISVIEMDENTVFEKNCTIFEKFLRRNILQTSNFWKVFPNENTSQRKRVKFLEKWTNTKSENK